MPLTNLDALRRLAIVTSLLAIVISVSSTVAFYVAFGGSIDGMLFGAPSTILGHGSTAAVFLRWGAIGDMFYSYVLLVPLALYLHQRLRPRMPWLADLGTVAGLAYMFVGGAGAAILATAGSALVDAYSKAAPADQFAIATSFDMLRRIVFLALWQTLDAITLGTWLLSVGWLIRPERQALGRLLILAGVGLFGASLITMLGVSSVVLIASGASIVLVVWAGWLIFDRPRPAPKA